MTYSSKTWLSLSAHVIPPKEEAPPSQEEEQTIYDDLFEEDSLGDEDWVEWDWRGEDWRDGYGNPTSPPEGLS